MKLLFFFAGCMISLASLAKGGEDSTQMLVNQLKRLDSIESSLHYKTGTVTLENGLATLNIKPGFKFLDAKEARYILEDVWGNMKGQTALGMIVPATTSAVIADYAFIIEYESIGYVKDEDADEINYDDLLKDMKKESEESNVERKKAGISTMELVGWASRPHYDKEKKLLYWAKEFRVEGEEEHTLNYDIRLLGRKGVLVLQAISPMSQLDSVNKQLDGILGMVSFNKGHQYADFDSKTDDVAAWTIGGLVAGKVLAKVGFFAVILKYLKFIVLGIIALGGTLWKRIRGQKKEAAQEYSYEPAPVEEEQRS